MAMNGDRPKKTDRAKAKKDKLAKADYAMKVSEQQMDALLKKVSGSKKGRSLAEKFRDAKFIGGADKNDPGDPLVRHIDLDKARKRFGIPGPRQPGNEYGGWKDHSGRPVDVFRGNAAAERPEGLLPLPRNISLGRLLNTLADDRTWKQEAARKAAIAKKGKPVKSKPEFFKMLGQLSRHADSATQQFGRLEKTGKNVDIALTLAVMSREGRHAITDDPKSIDSYGGFGLDLLYAEQSSLRKEGYLPKDFPKLPKGDGGSWKAKWGGKVYNEIGQRNASIHELVVRITGTGKTIAESFDIIETVILPKTPSGKNLGTKGCRQFVDRYRKTTTESDVRLWRETLDRGLRNAPGLPAKYRWRALLPLESKHVIQPAKVPGNRMVEAAGAKITRCRDTFYKYARAAKFDDATLKGISKDVERAWTSMVFIAPGATKNLLKRIRRQDKRCNLKSLDDILKVPTDSDYIKDARVRAAEAHMIETTVLQDM
jgi:hypothetical protein